MTNHNLCPTCESRRAMIKLLLAWAAVLAGVAGVMGALATLAQVFVR